MRKKLLFYFLSLFSLYLFSQEAYYNDVNVNLTGIALKNALATKITTTHTNNLSYTPSIWNASMITDVNPTNSMEVLLIYGWENGTDGDVTNDRERDINNNGGSLGQWNREHVYANSLAVPDLDQGGVDGPPYADAIKLTGTEGASVSVPEYIPQVSSASGPPHILVANLGLSIKGFLFPCASALEVFS